MPFLEVPGCRLYFEVAGHGRLPLVFVHGGACTHQDWDSQVEHLTRDFTVVTLDTRGHGRSRTENPDSCTVSEMAADLVRLLDHLDLVPAVLVGHSFGCRLVLQAACDRPDRVAGVVLVDGSRVPALLPAGVVDVRTHFDRVFAATAFLHRTDEASKHRILHAMRATPVSVLRSIGRSTSLWDAAELPSILGRLKVPVLAIQSTHWNMSTDRRTLRPGESTPWLQFLAASLRQLTTVVIADTGHFCMSAAPQQVNEAIRVFADGLTAGSTAPLSGAPASTSRETT